jgi:hypothetical protein
MKHLWNFLLLSWLAIDAASLATIFYALVTR